MSVSCPIECVRSACPDPDFLEKHSTFVLTLSAALFTCVGATFSFLLKSRCSKIATPCLTCDRNVLNAEEMQAVNVQTTQT